MIKLVPVFFVLFSAGVGLADGQMISKGRNSSEKEGEKATIVCPANALPNIKLAAKEVRRYIYLRTGELLKIAEHATGNTISFRIEGI